MMEKVGGESGGLRLILAPTVDDINPCTLPIVRNMYHNSHSLGSLRLMQSNVVFVSPCWPRKRLILRKSKGPIAGP